MSRHNANGADLPGGLKYFPALKPQDFTHPLDHDALEVLRKIPVLDQVIDFINKTAFERYLYLYFISGSVRINERMLPKLYEKFRWALKVLDLEEDLAREGRPEPELYVTHSFIPNAITAGTNQTFIVLHSSLIDGFSEKDWLYLIGHELGHVKAGHVLYLTVAMVILYGLKFVKVPGADLLRIPLLEWMRKAELTADRAAALCVQEATVCQNFHMRMAGGVRSMFSEMDLEEFIRQVDLYNERDDNIFDLFSKVMLTMFRTHPFPIFRAKELRVWMNGYDYERLMRRGVSDEAPALKP